ENILTVPNILTTLRIAFTPAIGYFIVTNNFPMAVGALAIASFTDFVDGWIARTFDMKTVLGSVLDPAADKFLMTTLVVTLSIADLLPVPLAVLILGRDIALIMASIYVRYITLPPPKTWRRYWDVSLPTAEVHSPFISKVNTALQLALMAASITAPMFDLTHFWAMDALRLTVGVTTIWSGLSMFSKGVVTRVR
ncbi:CDP-alcohol phosphatidyltransferase-domain-containing protein, partial [Cladochytrium replicatum]